MSSLPGRRTVGPEGCFQMEKHGEKGIDSREKVCYNSKAAGKSGAQPVGV